MLGLWYEKFEAKKDLFDDNGSFSTKISRNHAKKIERE
jgi:hypothetical protein